MIKTASSNAIKPDTYNTLLVGMTGGKLIFDINGQQVATISDSDLTSGRWGLAADMDDNVTQFSAYFAEVEVGEFK